MPESAASVSDQASRAWDVLCAQVDQFVRAWEAGGAPPDVASYLPVDSPNVRRMTLVELVKVDLEERWKSSATRLRLEEYVQRFPELAADGGPPCDLIYEEYHVRRQAGDKVDANEILTRFPNRAAELRRLLGEADQARSASLLGTARLPALSPGDRLDDFDLLAILGQGTFAAVYLARQRSLARMVALKVSRDRGDEPQTLAQLDHPHIVRVFDQRVLTTPPVRLLYMQYVSGGTLEPVVREVRSGGPSAMSGSRLLNIIDRALADRGEQPPDGSSLRRRLVRATWPEVVCWIGARLADALDYAHRQGVLHRDLKPANVMLTAEGSPKLVDFNTSYCSKLEGATPAAFFGGSLAYMSPEQLEAYHPSHSRQAAELNGASDVYALGVLLWEMLCGRRPYTDGELDDDYLVAVSAMAQRRRQGLPPEASLRLPVDAPEGLAEILLTCLAPEPGDRFASGSRLARRLEVCLEPRLRRLVHVERTGWRSTAARHSWAGLLVAGVIPNVVASLFNIAYNATELVGSMGPAAKAIFKWQLATVNPIAYTAGVVIVTWLAWPVIRAVWRIARTQRRPSGVHPAHVRALWLGDITAWVTGLLWAVSGVVFPAWLAAGSIQLDRAQYVHFMSSQVVFGLLAATQSFFAVTGLVSRVFGPLLLPGDTVDAPAADRVRHLARRARRVFALTVSIPMLAIVPMVFVDTDRVAFLVLAVLGLAGNWLAYRLSQEIQADLDALARAHTPAEAAAQASDGSEAFWTASR